MSLTSRIQDQKDHITQVKKDLCSKVGIPSEPLPSFSEIIGSVPLYSNYVASSSDNIQFGFFNYNGNIYIMYQVKGKDATSDYWSTFISNNIGQIDKIFPKEKYGITQ